MVIIISEIINGIEYKNTQVVNSTFSSLKECIKIYGLGVDCEYRILSVEEIK